MTNVINMVAFERRCIRSGGVVPLIPTKEYDFGCRGVPQGEYFVREWGAPCDEGGHSLFYRRENRECPPLLSRAPCRRGASSLSVQTLFMTWVTQG